MSYVKINSDTLREMCEYTIKGIKKWRKEIDEKTLQEEIERLSNRGFLGRLLKLPPKKVTHEEVIKSLINSWADYPTIRGRGNLEVCEKLLKLCDLGSPVEVSLDDAEYLWIPKK